jgi:hypothetical protein
MLFFDKVIQEHITSEALLTSDPVFEINGHGRAIPSPFSHRQLRILFEDMKTVISSQVHVSEQHGKMLEFTFRTMSQSLEYYAGSDKDLQAEGMFIDSIHNAGPIAAPTDTTPGEEDSLLELCRPLMPIKVDQDLGRLLYRLEEDYPGTQWREKLSASYSNGKFDISSLPAIRDKTRYKPVYPGTELEPGYTIHDPTDCIYCKECSRNWPEDDEKTQQVKNLTTALDHLQNERYFEKSTKAYVLKLFNDKSVFTM